MVTSLNGSNTVILDGIRVLDYANLLVGPYCASLLGDLGADVIKIEAPGKGDVCRTIAAKPGEESFLFAPLNRSKKSITLDLGTAKGREISDNLIQSADVVIVNYRPDLCERYGLAYERISRLKPDIIYLHVTAFGEEGPYAEAKMGGTDVIFQGASGMMYTTGDPGQGPLRIGFHLCDMTTSLFSAYGVMAALIHRSRTGEGQKISTNLLDASMCLQASPMAEYLEKGKLPEQQGNDNKMAFPVGLFQCRDACINLSAFTDKTWAYLCDVMDITYLLDDPRYDNPMKRSAHRDELKPILNEKFIDKTVDEWVEILSKGMIPCGPVHNYDSMMKDKQIVHNKLIKTVQHPEKGELRVVGNPVRFSKTPVNENRFGPGLGADTDPVLSDMGYTEEEISRFHREGVV